MATVIDITGKIKNEEKFIVYNGKSYKVNDSKNNMMEVYALLNDEKDANLDTIAKAMSLLIGDEAIKNFDDLAYSDYLVPFFAALACVQNKTYEDVEASFRGKQ